MTDNADTALRHVLAVRELDELTRLRAENERLQNVHTFLLEDAASTSWTAASGGLRRPQTPPEAT